MEVQTFHLKPKEATLVINNTEKVISHKVGLLNLAEQLHNISQACK